MRHIAPLLAAGLLLAASAPSQTQTQHTILIGGPGATGCQNSQNPPTLDDGITEASARLDLTYDTFTRVLRLDVSNTSHVLPGVPNPLLTAVAFNLPLGAVTGVQLLAQQTAGGTQPGFALTTDVDLTQLPNPIKMACFGDFCVLLSRGSVQGGLANPAASVWSAPPASVVIGPAQVDLQLVGPGTDQLTASIIAAGFSQNVPAFQANAAAKFQAGGAAGSSGFLGNPPGCNPTLWVTAPPRIGSSFGLCIGAAGGCHGCLLGSAVPGPVQVGSFSIPIGFPIPLVVQITPFPAQPACFPITLANDPALVGANIYLTVATIAPPPVYLEFSPAFTLGILP